MSRKYFGTDGIRGHVGQFPITPDFVLKLGWAAGMAFRKKGSCKILIGKDTVEEAMDAAACIGCGACVAACKNASAMLFVSAKVSQLSLLPQGQPERPAGAGLACPNGSFA